MAGATNSGSTCPAITACGGDLVGDWTVQQLCLTTTTMDAVAQSCPGATFSLSPITATGTISFRADSTMSASAVVSLQEFVRFPASCYTEAECTAYGAAASAATTITDSPCKYDVATGCSCTLTSTQPTMSSGSYQVQGNNVTITSSASSKPELDSFCVSGNTLSIFQVTASGTSSSMILTR
jgi:hypothetical protein